MMAHCRGVKTRIDPAKENAQIRSDNVANRLFSRGEKLLLGWFPGFDQLRSVDIEMCLSRDALF